jgi:multidrug efflux pump
MLPSSFVPNEDKGYVMAAIIMPDAASLDRTAEVTERVEKIFEKIPGVENRTQFAGYGLLDGGNRQSPFQRWRLSGKSARGKT